MKIPTIGDVYQSNPKWQAQQAAAAQGEPKEAFVASQQTPLVDRQALKELFLDLVKIKGRSYHERQIADTLTSKMTAMGYTVKEDQAASKIGGNSGNLLVDVPGTIKDAPGLIFLAHMDTVRSAEGVKPVEKDGVIYSNGRTALGGDDRAGDAELLTVMKLLKEKDLPHPPLQFIFTVGEEAGLVGSKALDPKDVHGRLGFEADFFHPNEILWGVEWGSYGPLPGGPHPRNPEEAMLESFTFQAIRDIGLKPDKWEMNDASSDSASLRQLGIPALIIGAGEQDVHTSKEHISVEDMGKATELMLQIIQNANSYKVDSDNKIVPRS